MDTMGQGYVSDELTHFVGKDLNPADRFGLLLEIMRTRYLRASYRVEFGAGGTVYADRRKPVTSNSSVRAAAVCFCDIPVEHLSIHMDKYSPFGLAFKKKHLVARGASPVFYVARNAAPPPCPGIGSRSLGEKFDVLYKDLQSLQSGFREFLKVNREAWPMDGKVTVRRSPPGTPPAVALLGQLDGILADLDSMVFAHLKFFDPLLADDHEQNYYMEREWRVMGGLGFGLDNVSRVILPPDFVDQFRGELPEYRGPLTTIEEAGTVSTLGPGG